jgi:hypothetical protein
MLVRVTWVNGAEMDLEIGSLRELDGFLGRHAHEAVVADLRPYGLGLRLVFSERGAGRTRRSDLQNPPDA